MKKKLLSVDARMLFAGGIGTYEQNLLKRMDFESLGMPVDIYYRTDEEADWLRKYQPKVNLVNCPFWIYSLKEQLFWLKNLKGGAFWAPNYNIPIGGYEKLVVTLHDAALCMTPYATLMHNIYSRVMYSFIRAKADTILAVSEFAKKMTLVRGHIFTIPIHVTPLGVEPTWFTGPTQERAYPFRYIVFVGNIKAHKNLPRFLQAFKLANVPHKLVCIGPFKNLKSRDEKALQAIQSMPDKVVFLDEVVGEPLQNIVKHSEGLVLPSLEEGFGLPPLEAMASKVPALVSNIGPLPEVCGDCALYCDPGSVDSMAQGLQALVGMEPQARKEFIAKGYDHAATFNWDTTTKQTLEVLKNTFV